MNTIALVGRLTKDVDLRVQGDTQVANFTLAVARPYKSDETDFIRCVAWGKNAEIISQYAGTQGTQLAVRGRLEISSYEKDVNGTSVTMWSSQVVVEQQTFIGNKNDFQGQQQGQFQNQQQGFNQQPQFQGQQVPQQDFSQQQFQNQQQVPQQDFNQQPQFQNQQQGFNQQPQFQGQQSQQAQQGQQQAPQNSQFDPFASNSQNQFSDPFASDSNSNPFGNAVGDDDLPF